MHPLFSIIIPCFNSENTIKRCIKSILTQAFTNFEIIIQDGLSHDNTINLVKQFTDIRIVTYSEKDYGVYDAMNKGIKKARGKWLYFLGSDDWLYNDNVLLEVSKFLLDSSPKIIYGNVKVSGSSSWANDGEIYGGEIPTYELIYKNICHQAIFFNKEVFLLGKLYDLLYPYCADHDFNLYCAAHFKLKYIDLIVANFTGGGLSSTENDVKFGEDRWRNIVEYFGLKLLKKEFKIYKSDIRRLVKSFFKTTEYKLGVKALCIYLYLKAVSL